MKRCLLALLALLVQVVGIAHADYAIIRINLGLPPAPEKAPQPVGGPQGFMMPQGGGINKFIPKQGIGNMAQGPMDKKDLQPDNSPPLTIVVFFEYEKGQFLGKDEKDTGYTRLKHKWGLTDLAFDQRIIHVTPLYKQPSVTQRYKAKSDELTRKRDKAPKDYLELADWCLTNGLLETFKTHMDKLAELEVKDPDTIAIVKAYNQVKENVQKALSRDDDAIAWAKRMGYRVTPGTHYVMLHDENTPTAEAQGRLNRLEKNYQLFFYWFALRGKTLPMPNRRLVALLIDSPADFKNCHAAFDSVPLVADGFFARRDNLAVISSNRLDEPYDALSKHLKELIQSGWNFKTLVQGQRPRGKAPDEVAYAQTMALIQKCLQEESEIATITHEGTCQLLTATGLLPRAVTLPEWCQYGLPSVFSTPKYDPILHTGAFWHGYGMPHWTHVVHYKLMEMNKELDPAEDALRNVVTDQYFRQARLSKDPEALLKARTMSWSLCYYLAQRNLDGLIRYGQELNNLPRDLEFDDNVHIGCFARAFNLMDASKPGTIDPAKFRTLANDWQRVAGATPLPMKDALEEAQKALKELREKKPGGAVPLPR